MALPKPIKNLLFDGGEILFFTLLQSLWMSLFVSRLAGAINLLPTFVFLAIWYWFVKVEFKPKKFWLYFLPGFILTLRLPLTLSRNLEPLSWLLYFAVVGLVLQRIISYNQLSKKVPLLIVTILLIVFNSVGHLSVNSQKVLVEKA